ncbi:ATP-binding protein [Candidatus Woesearchaeota archaeon]|nr:ATP-binding protein [Candidatus Woesearchaeota archaeon]
MSYEIPPPLQHKEKIIFNLTFEQLLYAGTALLIDGVIFKVINNSSIKFTLIGITTTSAVLFMFFKGKEWIKNLYHFYKFRKADIYSNLMKEFIGIKEVNNYIINNKNQKIAVLEVHSINFNIKTELEQEAIILGFQKLLNSIDFPIQIIIASENISLEDHYNKLESKTKNKALFNFYKNFINKEINNNEIKNRKFYIIIKESSNLEIQTNILTEKLRSIGLKTNIVNKNELLNKLHNYFNPYNLDIELKEGEVKNKENYLTSPKLIINKKDYLIVNNSLNRIVASIGYPNIVEKGFLDKIISSNDNYDVSIHIEPFPIDFMLIQLNNELKKQKADIYTDSLKGIANPSLEIKHSATRKTLEELQKGNQKLFNFSLYINCKTKPLDYYKLNEKEIEEVKKNNPRKKESEEVYNHKVNSLIENKTLLKAKHDLDLLSRKVSSELNSIMIQPSVPLFRQADAFKSIIPISDDSLKLKRNITTEGLSAFFPFTSPFLNTDLDGIMLGLNKNKIPFIKDIYKLTNANGLVLATSGGGKSYFTKLLLTRLFLQGTKILIVDPQSEYLGITKECKGQIITISKDSKTIINPLDLMGKSYEDKRLSLIDLFKVMLGDLTEVQRAILDKAIDETYSKKYIKKDSDIHRTPPIISDLHETLMSMERQASSMEKVTYTALVNRLYIYTTKGVFGFLDKQTNINFNNDFVCFNIGSMPKQVKPVIMFLVLDYIYEKMKENLDRKLLVLDEAWSLLARAEEEGYIFEIVKTCRKFNLGLLMITQDVSDLVNSKAGHAALANSSYTFLLRQKPAIIDNVAKVFNLSKHEKNFLLTCNVGNGLLILDNEHQELEIKASPEEHKLITTNPDEIKEEKNKSKTEDKKGNFDIKLDINKDYYEGNKLSLEEKEYLLSHGYGVGRFHKFDTNGNPNEYYVKEKKPEGLLHSFVVALCYESIKTKTDKVSINVAGKEDIVFEDKKGKKWAIEIETGIDYKKHKERLNEKFTNLKNKYGKRCFILLTNFQLLNNYKKYDIVVISRSQLSKIINVIFN